MALSLFSRWGFSHRVRALLNIGVGRRSGRVSPCFNFNLPHVIYTWGTWSRSSGEIFTGWQLALDPSPVSRSPAAHCRPSPIHQSDFSPFPALFCLYIPLSVGLKVQSRYVSILNQKTFCANTKCFPDCSNFPDALII